MAEEKGYNTCCFTGHRKLPKYRIEGIVKRLDQEVNNLIHQGVTDFVSGGAIGFDLVAASLIIAKREMGKSIRLVFALPCPNYNARWAERENQLLSALLGEADEVVYVSDEYNDDCMKLRNEYMVNRSAHCICALLHQRSGTSQTVNFARNNGLNVINVAK